MGHRSALHSLDYKRWQNNAVGALAIGAGGGAEEGGFLELKEEDAPKADTV